MAFDFGAALSSAGSIQPALQAQREHEAEQARTKALFEMQQRQSAQQLQSNALLDTYRQAETTRLQRENDLAKQQWLPQRSYTTSTGEKHTVYLTPEGYKDEVDTPGRKSFKQFMDEASQVFGSADKVPQWYKDQALAQSEGVTYKEPTLQRPQLKVNPVDGTSSWVYPPDATTGAVPPPVPVKDAAGKPFGGFKPESVTIRNGVYHFVGADNQVHEVPETTETRRIYGPSATQNTIRPLADSARAGAPIVPRGTSPAAPPPRPTAPGYAGKTIGPAKLSSQDKGILETDQQITDATARLVPLLEKLKNNNSFEDKARMEGAWRQYQFGFQPSDDEYGPLIKDAAFLGIAGAGPWTRIGRNKYTFEVIQQHLPKPSDTPALMYSKVKWLADNVIPSSERSITNTISSPQSGSHDPAVDNFLKNFPTH